jgi:hypothetical protein
MYKGPGSIPCTAKEREGGRERGRKRAEIHGIFLDKNTKYKNVNILPT